MLFKSSTIKWCTVLLLFVAIMPSIALGQGMPSKIVPCDGVNCTVCDIATLAQNVLNTGIFIAVFLSAVLFAWAGGKYLVSATDPKHLTDAKAIFNSVFIGLLIILSGWLIVDTLMKVLTNGSFGPWNKVCEILIGHFMA